jgi:SAM-dependent methyltransferase
MWAEKVTKPFDAAVFFECFHHCADHNRLLKALRSAVKPGGKLYFAAEPILADFPVPWGLRADGESLWATRSNGWMELGFSESYFQEALRRAGWNASKHVYPDLAWAAVREARRIGETA